MARLPTPGSDDGTWGDILNDFLSTQHNADGTHSLALGNLTNVNTTGAANGQVLKYNGSSWVPGTDISGSGGGDPAVGGDLSGTASNAQIVAGAVGTSELADGQVTELKLSSAVQTKLNQTPPVTSVNSKTGTVVLDKTDIGLANVDNTSDVNKPVSSATQTALNAKVDTSRSVSTTNSLTGGGDLSANRTLSLVGDSATPGNNRYYGTDGVGTRGFHTMPTQDPAVGGDLSGTASNAQVVAGAIGNTELATDAVTDVKVSATAAIAQSKIANLTTDLAGKVGTARQVATTNSLTGGGDLSANRTLSLVGDSATPGNNRYYGTDGTGTKGFYNIPTGDPTVGGDLTGTASNAQIAASAVGNTELATDAVTDVKVSSSAAIAQSKIANLTTDLAAKVASTLQVATTNSLTGGGDLSANRTLSLVGDAATPGNNRYYGTDGTGTKGFYTIPTGDPNVGGDLSGTASNAQIVSGAVGNTELATDAVTDVKVSATAAIAQSKIANLTTDLAAKIPLTQKAAASGVATLDGSTKIPVAQLPTVALTKVLPYSYAGAVATGVGGFRLYNDSGASWTIQSIRASVGTAPTGASLIIDVNKNGTTVFTTQANRPTIAASGNTSGSVTNMDVTSVASGEYLTVDIDQVGSTVAGSDLTVQVVVA